MGYLGCRGFPSHDKSLTMLNGETKGESLVHHAHFYLKYHLNHLGSFQELSVSAYTYNHIHISHIKLDLVFVKDPDFIGW